MTSALVENVNQGVAQIFENQKRLENETRQLQNQSVKFSKQTSAWLNLVENLNKSLKVKANILFQKNIAILNDISSSI